jgi:Na+/melibiose symporter-like transporter
METFGYLVVSLCLFDVFFGFYATPYLALGAEMTADYAERARVVATRAVAHNAGLLLGGAGFVGMAAALGGGHDAYRQSGVVLAVSYWSVVSSRSSARPGQSSRPRRRPRASGP